MIKEEKGKGLLKEFNEFFLTSSLPSMRIGIILTLIMFLCFAFFNLLFFPDSPENAYYQRFWIITPVLIATIILSYLKVNYRILHILYIILNLVMCILIFYVGMHSGPSVKGSEYYYPWVMLVVIGLFVFYKLPVISVVLIGLLQIIAFTVANILNGSASQHPFFFYNNLFFVLSVYSIGFIMAFIFKNLSWKIFLHQKALTKNNQQLLLEIKERKTAVDAFQRSELQYHSTVDAIPDWIYVIDREFRIIMINSSLKQGHLVNNLPVEVVGKRLTEIYPFMTEVTLNELHKVFKSGEISISVQKMIYNGRDIFMEIRKVPIIKNGEVIQVLTILRDKSKEIEVEELKQKNVEQKEIMLREIHHRVKNNLAIVISLLNLQLQHHNDPELLRIIRDIEMRIRSMALIHEHLYRTENLDWIPLNNYIQSLASIIASTFSGHRINLVTRLEPTFVSIETALPIGLIANELLTNAFKYAFPEHAEGEIQILLRKIGENEFVLEVKDNGVGLPQEFSIFSERSMGMFIVRLLTEQLDGKIDISVEKGTSFTIFFSNFQTNKQTLPSTEKL